MTRTILTVNVRRLKLKIVEFVSSYYVYLLDKNIFYKMSMSKGCDRRTRPQKYQNKTVFKNDLHDTSNKTKFINSLDINGVCKRCKDILEWKIKFKKYKPLSAPKKCVNCSEKSVKHAYHVMCTACAKSKSCCPKCCNNFEVTDLYIYLILLCEEKF